MTVTPPSPIYRLWNDGLGDHWASVNLLDHMARLRPASQTICFTHPDPEKRARAREILGLLHDSQVHGAALMCHTGAPDSQVTDLDGFDVWATPYFRTKNHWTLSKMTPTICVHFDGLSAASDKNPSLDEQHQILTWAAARGLRVVVLGDPTMSLSWVVTHLATCALFVGCDSGMSHIAHSVGCPTYLLEYNLPVVTCHRNKNYVLCKGAGHFMQQGDNWLHCMRTALGLIPLNSPS